MDMFERAIITSSLIATIVFGLVGYKYCQYIFSTTQGQVLSE